MEKDAVCAFSIRPIPVHHKAWKKWQGEVKGLERLGAVTKNSHSKMSFKPGPKPTEIGKTMSAVLDILKKITTVTPATQGLPTIIGNCLGGVENFSLASQLSAIISLIENKQPIN
jgi:hypothetical protein